MPGEPVHPMDRLFKPAGVAVVGASADPAKIGHIILGNIIDGGYAGGIYPINPRSPEILGRPAFKTLSEVTDPVDMAIICVPEPLVAGVVEDCGKKGVGYLVVVTSGFGEVGNLEGEKELVGICRQYGMRLLGPNIFGIINQGVRLNATFGPKRILGGSVALITQSGALGVALMGKAVTARLGLAAVVSVGNKADVDDGELLEYFAQDPSVRVVLIYMEGLKRGREFMGSVRKCVRAKPVIILKAGRSSRGAKAAASHTGSLAGFDNVFGAAFAQAGVLRADDIREAFDWARSLGTLPAPRGDNTVIITNGGGVGVLATDECERLGLALMEASERLDEIFSPHLPDFGSTRNPIDITGQGGMDNFVQCLKAAMAEKSIHSVICLNCEASDTDADELAGAIFDGLGMEHAPAAGGEGGTPAAGGEGGTPSADDDPAPPAPGPGGPAKPITFALVGGVPMDGAIERLHRAGLPAYPLPEDAVSALSVVHRRKEFLDLPRPLPEPFEFDRTLVRRHTQLAISEGRSQLLEPEAAGVLSAVGLAGPRRFFASNLEECRQAARLLGYPVVLKIVSEDIVHKSDAGGVIVGIESPAELDDAYRTIMGNCRGKYPRANIRGMQVTHMVDISGGVEVIIGATKDPAFGPVVMFGLGGIFVEIMKDVAFRVAPLNRREAREIIRDTKAFPVLYGARGDTVKDMDSLADILYKVGRLVDEVPGIAELDMNPVVVYARGEGCVPLDARITLDLDALGSPDYAGSETHDDYHTPPRNCGGSSRERAAESEDGGGEEREVDG